MLKHELRKVFLAKRNELTPADVHLLSTRIAELFLTNISSEVRTVHIFLPIEKKREVDTWPIIRWLWENQRVVVVPEMDEFNHNLISRVLLPSTVLAENSWAVPQPKDAPAIDDRSIDLIVLPLLTFDRRGFRVGYGSGYYDSYLASLVGLPKTLGLSFFPPVESISDIYSGDVPMDGCITPEGFITF